MPLDNSDAAKAPKAKREIVPDLFDTTEAATYLRLARPTLVRMRLHGDGPRYAKMTPGPRGPVRYRKADLDEWVAARLVSSTSAAA